LKNGWQQKSQGDDGQFWKSHRVKSRTVRRGESRRSFN
jgi:hypothetical protein